MADSLEPRPQGLGGQASGQADLESVQRVLVLSGPNLQRLGHREPDVYGRRTLEQLHQALRAHAERLGVGVDCRQSNHEGQLLDWIGAASAEGFSAILINPAAYTHTSVALYDGLLASALPCVEVHLSNPEAREAFRHRSLTAPACVGKVAGFGFDSYLLGLEGLVKVLREASGA